MLSGKNPFSRIEFLNLASTRESDGARDGGARARGGPSDGVAGIGLGANARATDEDSNENARLMTSSLD